MVQSGPREGFRLVTSPAFGDIPGVMSGTEATAEVFLTAFKSLKRRERDAVMEKILADAELAEDLADTLALEARRRQPREDFRAVLKELDILCVANGCASWSNTERAMRLSSPPI